MTLKIIEPIRNYKENFKSPREFETFYNSHRNEMDSLTTQALNKLYHIDGYRITHRGSELCLKSADTSTKISLDTLASRVESLEETYEKMRALLENLTNIVNSLSSVN